MAKIENDKYYTSPELAEYCVKKTKEVIGENNITEYVEPSAGSGVFLNYLDKPYLAYDIEPEDNRVVKADWLEVNLDYKKGRCIIGNPPFGSRNALATKFYKHAIKFGDYIAFILPVSQYDNNQKMYEFDLVYTENLGFRDYSGVNLNCAFNIYKRNEQGVRNKPIDYTLKDVSVIEYRRGSKDIPPNEWDFAMCTWGDRSCAKTVTIIGTYAQEHYIVCNNEIYKSKVKEICENTDWRHLCPSVSSAKLQTWRIYKYLKEQIPELN